VIRSQAQSGITLIEILVVLVISAILLFSGSGMYSKFGSKGAADLEASNLVNSLWELRAKATAGMKNPCLDFPDSRSFRLYSDTTEIPDGFGIGDKLLQAYSFTRATKALNVIGGTGPKHFVCFESKGVLGSASVALMVTLGRDSSSYKRVRLLPSTGMARVL
jgi:prepilin-type N-terminal cleavage/methylation domain-containing protein